MTMKNFGFILIIVCGFFVAAASGFFLSNYLNTLELSDNTGWVTINKTDKLFPPTNFFASPTAATTKVTCTGCEHNPDITTTDNQQNVDQKNTAIVGRVISRYTYTPDYYSLDVNKPVAASEIIYDILKRQDLGHLSSSVNIPNVSYKTTSSTEKSGFYAIPKNSVSLANNVSIAINFSIRVPAISELQYQALKNTADYRYVYGLIRGIVGHEELHFQALKTYITNISNILNSPINEDVYITASNQTEMRSKLNDVLLKTIKEKLADARTHHEEAQNLIDDPSVKHEIKFEFTDKVGEILPAPIMGGFRGRATFDFSPLTTPIPKPPKPNIVLE